MRSSRWPRAADRFVRARSGGSAPSASGGKQVGADVEARGSAARRCASGNRPPDSAQIDERRQLGHVVGEVVGQEAADVRERRPALLDGGDDRGEVVVEQHEVGGLAGDVGPRLVPSRYRCRPPGGPDRRSRRRRSSPRRAPVPAARARSGACPRVRRGRARRRRGRAAPRAPRRRPGGRAPSTRDRRRSSSPTSRGDRPCRRRVVAGDHRHADAGPPAGGDRGRRVPAAAGPRGRAAPSSSRSRFGRVGVVVGSAVAAERGRRRRARAGHVRPGACPRPPHPAPMRQSQHGRTASGAPLTSTSLAGRRLTCAAGARSKGKRRTIGSAASVVGDVDAAAQCERVDGGLHRIAMRDPLRRRLLGPPGRATRGRDAPARASAASAASCASTRRRRVVALARRRAPQPAGVHASTTAIAFRGERPGLVGADERRRAQGLDRLEATDERVPGGHALRADRQARG